MFDTMIRYFTGALFFLLTFQLYSQTVIRVDNSLLNRKFHITEVKHYLDSNNLESAIWALMNSIDGDREQNEVLIKRIKADKSDEAFVRLLEDVFWAYMPHVRLTPDETSETFYLFDDYILRKNELIAFGTKHGEEALLLDVKAMEQAKRGDIQGALESFNESLNLIPTAQRYYRRAQLYEALNENRLAFSNYDSSIHLNSFPAHYYARGELNLQLRLLDNAIRDFSVVIDSEFEYLLHGAYYSRALCYALKGNLNSDKKIVELSIPDFTKAIELNPTAEAYRRRGVSYYVIENMEASKKDFMQAIELNPNDAECYFFLVAFENDFKKKIALLDTCIKLVRDNEPTDLRRNAIGLRGIIYYDNGKKKKACEDFQRAMELGDQESTEHYYNLCGKYKKKNER